MVVIGVSCLINVEHYRATILLVLFWYFSSIAPIDFVRFKVSGLSAVHADRWGVVIVRHKGRNFVECHCTDMKVKHKQNLRSFIVH